MWASDFCCFLNKFWRSSHSYFKKLYSLSAIEIMYFHKNKKKNPWYTLKCSDEGTNSFLWNTIGRTEVLLIFLHKHLLYEHLFHYARPQPRADGERCQINGNSKVAKSPQSWTMVHCGVWPEAIKACQCLGFLHRQTEKPTMHNRYLCLASKTELMLFMYKK